MIWTLIFTTTERSSPLVQNLLYITAGFGLLYITAGFDPRRWIVSNNGRGHYSLPSVRHLIQLWKRLGHQLVRSLIWHWWSCNHCVGDGHLITIGESCTPAVKSVWSPPVSGAIWRDEQLINIGSCINPIEMTTSSQPVNSFIRRWWPFLHHWCVLASDNDIVFHDIYWDEA
jgi:hypothetical protein